MGVPASRLAVVALAIFAASCGKQQTYESAEAAYFHGDLPEALREVEAGARQHPRNDDPLFWKFRLLQAEALIDQGKIPQAAALLSEPAPASLGQIEVRRLVDFAIVNRSSIPIASQILAKARSQATDVEQRVRIAIWQATLSYASKDLPRAETEALQALTDAKALPGDRAGYYAASSLVSLGFFRKEENQASAALELDKQALALAQKAKADRIAAKEYLNMGYLYAHFGDTERAVETEKKAVAIFEKIGDGPNLLRALGETGLVLGIQGDAKQAVIWYQKAFDSAQQQKNRNEAGRFAANMALATIDLGQWDNAEHWNRLAADLQGSNIRIVMNAAEIALGRGHAGEFFRLCQEVIAGAKDPALRWQVHGDMAEEYAFKSDFKNAAVQFKLALAVFEQSRAEIENDDYLKITFLPRMISLYQGYVETLVRDNRSDEALAVTESSRSRVLEDRFGQSGKPRNRAIAAQANTILLSYWIAPQRSFLWLISGRNIRRFDLPSEDKIAAAVAGYKAKTEKENKDPLSPKFGNPSPLWSMLLEQAAPHIPPGSRVVVVPDGPLHQLNLETLVVPGPHPRYWLRDVELVVAPSLSLAPSFAAAPPTASPKLLLIGAADYSGTSYPKLLYAEEELKAIQARFPHPQPDSFENEKATPQAYLASQPAKYTMIHFAAHGEANPQSPLDSAVILAHSGSEYRLYAHDIFKVPIHANLVTVSACRSAGSKAYAGEGLIGFAWAFLASGARNVIGGLWDVDDESTAKLMSELYAGIASGLDPVKALHEAKLKLLKDYPKPYYWGPFQVYSASK